MLKPGDIAIVSGARTPFGRYCGKLKEFAAQELGAIAAKGAIDRAGIKPNEFDHVVFGNAQQTPVAMHSTVLAVWGFEQDSRLRFQR